MPANAQQDIIKSLFELSGITKETVTDELQKLLRDAARPVILFWDIDDIVQATSFKKTFLEENILCHPKVKQYERQRGHRGKRIWPCKQVAEAIEDIVMNEWN